MGVRPNWNMFHFIFIFLFCTFSLDRLYRREMTQTLGATLRTQKNTYTQIELKTQERRTPMVLTSRQMLWYTQDTINWEYQIVTWYYRIRHTATGAAGQTGQWKLTRSRQRSQFLVHTAQAVTWFLVRTLSAHTTTTTTTTILIATKTSCCCFEISMDDSTSSHIGFCICGQRTSRAAPDTGPGNPKMFHPNQLYFR